MDYLNAGKEVLNLIISNGFEAFFVGGVVRDYSLGIPFNDIDITTSASSDAICSLFPNNFKKGLKYQSITIKFLNYQFEITTYRIDLAYSDYRHPEVLIASTLKEDVARRDFTINAMAMDKDLLIYDYYNGLNDLKNKIIKTVNNPFDRFTEDALRMLRACYFAAKLNFIIEENTLNAIKKNSFLIKEIKSERVFAELSKIINSKSQFVGLKYIYDTGLADYIPDIKDGIKYLIENNIVIKDMVLFLSLITYFNNEITEYFKLSNELKNKIERIVELASTTLDGDFNTLLLYSYGKEVSLYANALNVILKYNGELSENIIKRYDALPIKKTCDLKFKGQDIMALYKKETGYWIGDIVDKIKYEVLLGNLENDYEIIKKFVIENFKD